MFDNFHSLAIHWSRTTRYLVLQAIIIYFLLLIILSLLVVQKGQQYYGHICVTLIQTGF